MFHEVGLSRPPVRKALFPVAGLGTRFLPATKAIPKEMLPILDKPLIQYAVEEALASGIEELIFITGKGKTALEDHFDRAFELESLLASRGDHHRLQEIQATRLEPGSTAYIRQQEPRGLGHAVWCARRLVGNEPFAVLLADDLITGGAQSCLSELMASYQEQGGNWVAVMDVPLPETQKYGILKGHRQGRVFCAEGIVEKPAPEKAPSTTAVVGRYVLSPRIFDHLEARILSQKTGEIQLTDGLSDLLQAGEGMAGEPQHLWGCFFEGTRFDCGSKEGMFAATVACALARPDLASFARDFLKENV